MSQYNVPPSLTGILKDMRARIKALEISPTVYVCTQATKPTNVAPGSIIFVSDVSLGQFQGWTGSDWKALG